MKLNLRHYLVDWLNHDPDGALEALENQGIRVARDERYPNLFCLKYGSILADKSSQIVCACRGAVVEREENGNFSLVAYAFDRFFNLGEYGCHNLDWEKVKVYEKWDGSLIKLFFYNQEWVVSTSGSVAAASDVGTTGRSFAQLFWDVFTQVGYSRENLDPNLCYIFELCHRDNRIVVDYSDPQLPLLAVRDRSQDLEELDLEDFGLRYGYKVAQSYSFSDPDAVRFAVNLRGAGFEGFVLSDGEGRCKSKSDVYCQLHKVRGNGDPDFSELFLNDDLDEFLLYFPDYREQFQPLLDKIEEYGKIVNATVKEKSHLSQKDFAVFALSHWPKLSGAMFAVRSGKSRDFAHFLESVKPKQLDNLLGF